MYQHPALGGGNRDRGSSAAQAALEGGGDKVASSSIVQAGIGKGERTRLPNKK